jgi:hypothetical protein
MLSSECPQDVNTTDVLHFRRALDFVHTNYPFSPAFGKVTTREGCIQSSQKVFERLQTSRRHVLDFKTLCQIAENDGGTYNRTKVKELVKMFRPNRLGEITKLDFVKSVDSVYKQLRLLQANIRNSSQIDRACK